MVLFDHNYNNIYTQFFVKVQISTFARRHEVFHILESNTWKPTYS